VAAINPAVPPQAATVISRLLAPDPADRFPSATVLNAELCRVLRDLPLPLPGGRGWLARLAAWFGWH
jgi:hypothetical protein